MINTENHGLIEPRAGDHIRDKKGRVLIVLDKSHKHHLRSEGYISAKNSKCLCHLPPWAQKGCTLIHRPFEVGDEIEIYILDGFVDTEPFSHRDGVNIEKYSENRVMYRHKNPAWRDHSEWRGYEQ